jgi:taurine dioxygenase
MDTISNTGITVIPSGAALAADVVGLDLSQPISPEIYGQLRKVWNVHLVLRFRGQKLDPQFLKFARLFGDLDSAPIHAGKDVVNPFPEITVMSNIKVNGKSIGNLGHYEAVWHSDMSYNERTPIGSLLYAIEVPPTGGNTGFSNMYRAYDTLPADLKQAIIGKTCRHDSSRNGRQPSDHPHPP